MRISCPSAPFAIAVAVPNTTRSVEITILQHRRSEMNLCAETICVRKSAHVFRRCSSFFAHRRWINRKHQIYSRSRRSLFWAGALSCAVRNPLRAAKYCLPLPRPAGCTWSNRNLLLKKLLASRLDCYWLLISTKDLFCWMVKKKFFFKYSWSGKLALQKSDSVYVQHILKHLSS